MIPPIKDAANDSQRGFEIVHRKIIPNGRGAVREKIAAEYMGFSVKKLQEMRFKLGAYRVDGTWWYPLAGMNTYVDECIRETWAENSSQKHAK